MAVTHYLDLRIEIDTTRLFANGDFLGVKTALGVRNDNEIITKFIHNFLNDIKSATEGYSNVAIGLVNLNEVDGSVESEQLTKEVESISTEVEEFFDEDETKVDYGSLASKVDDYIFNIETERGTVESVVVNNFELLEAIIAHGAVAKEDQIVVRHDLDRNFIVRYKNVDNQIAEMKEQI